MSYPIDITIPDAPNDPADDQPLMKQNFININSYLQVDHVTAGAPGNGFHKEVTFYSKNAAALPVDPTSVLYTADGTASTVADMRFRNANGIFPVSALRSCCVFVPDNAGVGTFYVPLNQFNVVTIQKTASLTYTITFVAGTMQSANFIPSIIVQNGAGVSYTTTSSTIVIVTSSAIQAALARISVVIFEI